jgi:hypothetical protein
MLPVNKTYLAEKKNTSHVPIGTKGKKNCLVTGTSSNPPNPTTAASFNIAGEGLIDSAKITSRARTIYWQSYTLHLCNLSSLKVSYGENDVSTSVIDDAGDCLACNLDRSFLLYRGGIGFERKFNGQEYDDLGLERMRDDERSKLRGDGKESMIVRGPNAPSEDIPKGCSERVVGGKC